MPIDYTKVTICNDYYDYDLVTSNPNRLFVFGDNCQHKGKGGQAVIRNLPNTFGIATKRKPSMDFDAFFADELDDFLAIDKDMNMLYQIYQAKVFSHIVFPINGLGTGLSNMPKYSPVAFKCLLNRLFREYGLSWHVTNKQLYFLD